jgi:Tfp pilus assembly protein PilV
VTHGKWIAVLVVLVLALAATSLSTIWWKSQSNCEATLIFAQAMERAVNANPNQTPAEKAKADAFFEDVYDRLHC